MFIDNFKIYKALDSFGRKPSGIMKGNTIWPGEYSQCININEKDWIGKYCYLNINDVNLFHGYKTIFV